MSRVLVVEDEAHLANGLRFNLEAEGYQVDIAADGEAALEELVVKGEHFDAVVLDVMLPGVDGFKVASAIREAKNYVPVLMLTARDRPEDVWRGSRPGADDYLPSPSSCGFSWRGCKDCSGGASGTSAAYRKRRKTGATASPRRPRASSRKCIPSTV